MESHLVFTAVFRLQKHSVRFPEKFLFVIRIIRVDAASYSKRYMKTLPFVGVKSGSGYHLSYPLCRSFGSFPAGPGQKHDKFFASETEEKIDFSQMISNGVRDKFQDFVTGVMTIKIIEFLEIVYVHDQKSERFLVSRGSFHLKRKLDFVVAPVIGTSQPVYRNHLLEMPVIVQKTYESLTNKIQVKKGSAVGFPALRQVDLKNTELPVVAGQSASGGGEAISPLVFVTYPPVPLPFGLREGGNKKEGATPPLKLPLSGISSPLVKGGARRIFSPFAPL